MLKNDRWIREQSCAYIDGELCPEMCMIYPFVESQISKGVISYGLSSYGYDIRVGNEFRIFVHRSHGIIDPKNFDPNLYLVDHAEKGYAIIPPNSFALAKTVEYFRIPRNVMALCIGKSTYARCGIVTNMTPFEPEWHGFATLEISNTTPWPAKIYTNEGIAQVFFLEADEECIISYADKKGKYQNQTELTLPKVE